MGGDGGRVRGEGGVGVAMACTTSGRMGVERVHRGEGRLGGGSKRGGGDGGRGSEREESKSGPMGRVHAVKVVVAGRVVGVRVDVAGVT